MIIVDQDLKPIKPADTILAAMSKIGNCLEFHSSAPSAPEIGAIYYDAKTNRTNIWTGNQWMLMTTEETTRVSETSYFKCSFCGTIRNTLSGSCKSCGGNTCSPVKF